MQQQQPMLSTNDFNMAAEIDTRNPDVYHHRGQVFLQRLFVLLLAVGFFVDSVDSHQLDAWDVYACLTRFLWFLSAEDSAGSGGRGGGRL